MFGLTEQIHGHPIGRGTAVGQHQNFTWPGNHVDTNLPKHPALGAGNIGITGAGDFVHARHRGRAIGQRRDGLRPTHRKRLGHARHVGCGQHQRVTLAVGRGHHHDHVAHPSHLGGHGVHEHTGGVRGFAAGYVYADTVEWRDFLPQYIALFVGVLPALPAGF